MKRIILTYLLLISLGLIQSSPIDQGGKEFLVAARWVVDSILNKPSNLDTNYLNNISNNTLVFENMFLSETKITKGEKETQEYWELIKERYKSDYSNKNIDLFKNSHYKISTDLTKIKHLKDLNINKDLIINVTITNLKDQSKITLLFNKSNQKLILIAKIN